MNVSHSIAAHFARQARTSGGGHHYPIHTNGPRPITVTAAPTPTSTTTPFSTTTVATTPSVLTPTSVNLNPATIANTTPIIASSTTINPPKLPPIEDHSPPIVNDDSASRVITAKATVKTGTQIGQIEDHSPPPNIIDGIADAPKDISKIDPIDQHGPVVPIDDSAPVEGKINPIRPHGPVSIDISSDDSDDVKVGLIAPHSPPIGAGDPIDTASNGGDDNRTLFDPAITGPANQFKSKLASASYAATASTTLVTGHAIPLNNLEA